MGMFDYINYECICPVCKDKADGFQSKDGECMLEIMEPTEVSNFYTHCNTCCTWIKFDKMDSGEYRRTVRGRGHKAMPQHTLILNI